MNYEMNNYEKKVRTEWICPNEIDPTKVEYAFMYELSALLGFTGLTLSSPEQFDDILVSCTTQLNVDDIEPFLSLFKKFGVYKVESAYNHFEIHAVAFNLQFGWSEKGYLSDVIVLKKTMYKQVYSDSNQLQFKGIANEYVPDMPYTEWTVYDERTQ